MERLDERDIRIRELEERLSRLSRASLRITEDLDFNTVLQGVLDSARSLTGARYGAITLVDGSLGLQDVFFSGVTEQEARQFRDMPGGEQLLRYFGELPGALRVADLNGHLRAMGLPELGPPTDAGTAMSFLLAPITNRGERVGYILLGEKLGEKEGGQEFTHEDEETLVLFAAQAAMAIANARRHREEQRARADLETLIDTSPVGVVVFDAVTGAPKSFNREARRIVDSLRNPRLPTFALPHANGRQIHVEREVSDLKRQRLGNAQARTPLDHHQKTRPRVGRGTHQRVYLVCLQVLLQFLFGKLSCLLCLPGYWPRECLLRVVAG